MTQVPVRLIPLVCVKCRAPLPAAPDEVAWVCEQCGQGQILDDEKGLLPMSVYFSKNVPQGKNGRPFWVARGQVSLTTRATYSGNEERAAREFWSAPRLFYVPAWDASLDETMQMGVYLLQNPQRMEVGSPVRFLPVVTPPGDLRAMAELFVVSVEADRKDKLKTVDFNLSLEPAQLWVLD